VFFGAAAADPLTVIIGADSTIYAVVGNTAVLLVYLRVADILSIFTVPGLFWVDLSGRVAGVLLVAEIAVVLTYDLVMVAIQPRGRSASRCLPRPSFSCPRSPR
jgi:hypothetical protein